MLFINPAHEAAHKLLQEGKTEEALVLYSQALEENADHPDILSDRGVAYLHLKMREECFADLNRSLELQPDYAYRYASRAYAKNFFGDLDGAILDYEKAVSLDPDDAIAHNNLGLLLEQKGYFKESKDRFERADRLSKLEKDLYEVMDNLETSDGVNSTNDPAPKEEQITPADVSPSPEIAPEPGEEVTKKKEALRIFTSRKQFREFIRFIRNGFKLK